MRMTNRTMTVQSVLMLLLMVLGLLTLTATDLQCGDEDHCNVFCF